MGYRKEEDPYIYVKAEDFFSDLDSESGKRKYRRVENVRLLDDPRGEVTHHGRAFIDNNGKILLIDFVRPTVFRIRFHPERKSPDEYSDWNSRNLVQDTMADLISTLDKYERIDWEVVCRDERDYVELESRPRAGSTAGPPPPGGYYMQIHIRKKNFQVIATRHLRRYKTQEELDLMDKGALIQVSDDVTDEKVVWQSKPSGVLYSGKTAVIEVEKPGRARYLGFGEQGGRQLLKTKSIVDYFNYDNMRYLQMYGQGPLDSREPLYHSEPFWMEVAQHPGHKLKVASFVDNLSQVCLDIGSKNNSAMRVVTRFNSLQLFVVVSDTIGDVINSYTSTVGRPNLKPRYVLGYHQGCYGYDTRPKIEDVVNNYRNAGFPLDGLHIDVDFQDNYSTFTVDQRAFPDPKGLLTDLRNKGIKCSTNITPFINGDPNPNYQTLQEGLAGGYFVNDKRYTGESGPTGANDDQYMLYRGGSKNGFQASDLNQEPRDMYRPRDQEALSTTWNTGKPFRGGVWYGGSLGRPGHYPNLNRHDVREWWGRQYNYLISLGLEFVWQDMTSPCMGASYGDMKSFPFRLQLTSDAVKSTKKAKPEDLPMVPAIQIWSLYAYNLHKATYKGWNINPDRKDKRNFIIGRGGYIGLHRYAGLWTGDNASQWEFLKVSVAQVLSLGLSGITISGGDVGGFEPASDGEKWANPELVMRWYCAYSLLPWFRNHYNGKPGKKDFQEPFRYDWKKDSNEIPPNERWLYYKTLPMCLYYVKLRYTLLQLLYDQMFNNLITGLPIARSLIISNEDDDSLVVENSEFLDDEYMVGDDILVAPILHAQGESQITRVVYLPRPDSWWQSNLSADGADQAIKLYQEFEGGSLIPYDARMNFVPIPFATPIFIRFGAIIPQIEPRMYAEDWSKPNPITIHVYPGRVGIINKSYDMYLDDGVSRESAPTATNLQSLLAKNKPLPEPTERLNSSAFGDEKAADVYWKVRIKQETTDEISTHTRTISVETIHLSSQFDPTTIYGKVYNLIIWGEPKRANAFAQASPQFPPPEGGSSASAKYDQGKNAWVIEVAIKDVFKPGYNMKLSLKYSV